MSANLKFTTGVYSNTYNVLGLKTLNLAACEIHRQRHTIAWGVIVGRKTIHSIELFSPFFIFRFMSNTLLSFSLSLAFSLSVRCSLFWASTVPNVLGVFDVVSSSLQSAAVLSSAHQRQRLHKWKHLLIQFFYRRSTVAHVSLTMLLSA